MEIIYTSKINNGATEYYGSIVVSDIKYSDGSAVTVSKELNFSFHSPAVIKPTNVEHSFIKWENIVVETTNNQITATDILVNVKVKMPEEYTLVAKDNFTIEVNGNLLTGDVDYINTFIFSADSEVNNNGDIIIVCPEAPDIALSDLAPKVVFATKGGQKTVVNAQLNASTTKSLPAADYTLSVERLENADKTVSAEVSIQPENLTVLLGKTYNATVEFGAVERYASIDFKISDISQLELENFSVQVTDQTGASVANFDILANDVMELRYLPTMGTLNFAIETISLNNKVFSFNVPPVTLANKLFTVVVGPEECTVTAADTSKFPHLNLSIQSDSSVSQVIPVRLTGEEMSYYAEIAIGDSLVWPEKVKSGSYSVSVENFITNKTVYVVSSSTSLLVGETEVNTLVILVEKSASLVVPGFPEYLSFGALADLTPTDAEDFVAARTTSIFKYAGTDGAGDSTVFLEDDLATTHTIELARDIESKLGNNQKVLPIMISYTCNLSGGNAISKLADEDGHMHSLANFILAMNIANAHKDEEHPIPAGFVVNADLIGACQQVNITSDHIMPVRKPLADALAHHSIDAEIPDFITDTLYGYVQTVNWLARTVAPNMPFGWVVNLWGVGSSQWIYDKTDVTEVAKKTVDFVNTLGVFAEGNAAHFMAIDRYEADDLTLRGYSNTYCYGPLEWKRYYQFCEAVSHLLKMPVMPWQIPASRTPLKSDDVHQNFDDQHWGTSANYLLGDSQIADNVEAINDVILDFTFPSQMAAFVGNTPRDMYLRGAPFDLSQPAYETFPQKGIFTVLLGGGSTTGVVTTVGNPDNWVRNKLNAYMDAPVQFGEDSDK